MDQRRFLIALVLSFLLLYAYEQLVVRPYRKAPAPTPQGEHAPQEGVPPAPEAVPPAAPQPPAENAGLAAAAGDLALVTIETDLIRAAITPVGARLKTLELKKFRQSVAPNSPPLDLVKESQILPMTVEFGDGRNDAAVVYTTTSPSITAHGEEVGAVVFAGTLSDGRTVQKRYRFPGNSYLFDVEVSGSAIGQRVGLVLTPISEHGASGGQQSGLEHAVALANEKVIQETLDAIKKEAVEIQAAVWAGFSAQYFAAIAIPSSGPGTVWVVASAALPFV